MTSLEAIEPKSRKLVLAQYVEHEKYNLRGNNLYWYAPNHWNRWLVRLDCECITEVLTHHKYGPPAEHMDSQTLGEPPIYKQTHIMHPHELHSQCMFNGPNGTPFPSGCCKPKGSLWCSVHDDKPPWREVVQYIARTEYRNDEGELRCYWSVILSCGHCYTSNTADLEWSPGMPPNLDQRWIAKLEQRFRTEWKERDDEAIRDLREQVEHKGFMVCRPAMEEECSRCAYQRQIVDYRLIGKLSDEPWQPPKPEEKPQPTPEEIEAKKQRRLKRIESDIRRLQREAESLRDDPQDGEE